MDPGTTVSVVKKSTNRRLSRYGCRNCKLRKLKCDETRPRCERCRTYGVHCNFGYNVPDLHPLHQSRVTNEVLKTTRVTCPPPRALISNAVWSSNDSHFLRLDEVDQDLFGQFRCRTVRSLGGSALISTVEDRILTDSIAYPALMHGILAMAAAHSRYLGILQTRNSSIRELYHSSECLVLFKKSLKGPIEEENKDAVWATGVMLAVLAFSSLNASSFEEAWPLKPSDSSDLQWLRLKTSDKVLWKLANPMRSSSAFRVMSGIFSHNELLPTNGIEGISDELAKLCGLDDTSTAENNPYFGFVHALSRLLVVPVSETSLGRIFMVIGVMSNAFLICLEGTEPVALMLLYLWYTRARGSRWWIDHRARYELPAIRAYLQRCHVDNHCIQALLLTGCK